MNKTLLILAMVFSAYLVNAQIVINEQVNYKGLVGTGLSFGDAQTLWNKSDSIATIWVSMYMTDDEVLIRFPLSEKVNTRPSNVLIDNFIKNKIKQSFGVSDVTGSLF